MWQSVKDKASLVVERILRRKLAYMDVFTTTAGRLVLKDLSKFCNAFTSSAKVNNATGNIDPLQMAYEEGKRSVLNRIKHYVNLDDEQIYKYYKEQD